MAIQSINSGVKGKSLPVDSVATMRSRHRLYENGKKIPALSIVDTICPRPRAVKLAAVFCQGVLAFR